MMSSSVGVHEVSCLAESLRIIDLFRKELDAVKDELVLRERSIRFRMTQEQVASAPSGCSDGQISDVVLYGDVYALLHLKKEKARQKVFTKIEAMIRMDVLIASGRGIVDAAKEVAEAFGRKSGFAKASLYRDYSLWSKGGRKTDANGHFHGNSYAPRDWAIFIPAYNNGDQDAAVTNMAFIVFVKKTWTALEPNKRNYGYLHKLLVSWWFRGEEIPGYGTISGWRLTNVAAKASFDGPRGWSPNNLRRIVAL